MIPIPKLIDKSANEKKDMVATKKSIEEKDEKELGLFSVLEMIPYSTDAGASNKLLSITNMCNSSSLIVFADTQHDVEKLITKGCSSVLDILQNSFYQSQATRMISAVNWPEDYAYLAFPHASCLINQEECSEKIRSAY